MYNITHRVIVTTTIHVTTTTCSAGERPAARRDVQPHGVGDRLVTFMYYPVVRRERSTERLGYPYSLYIPYEQWGAKELLRVSQPSSSGFTMVFSLDTGWW